MRYNAAKPAPTDVRQFFSKASQKYLSFGTVKGLALCAILFAMPIRSSVAPRPPRPSRTPTLADQPQVRDALAWFEENSEHVTDIQIALTEIPAPSFQETKRAEEVKRLLAGEGLRLQTDKLGNVVGELPGENDKESVILAAHLDTVFPAGTEVNVKREGDRLVAPGISDNGTGLAGLIAVARAMHAAHIKPQRTILFAANVGEEGEGNLRGMRALIDRHPENRDDPARVMVRALIRSYAARRVARRQFALVVTMTGKTRGSLLRNEIA